MCQFFRNQIPWWVRLPTILAIGMMSGCTASSDQIEEATYQPNIILMVADDHGKDAMGCYGNSIIKTPNLDRLATSATRFDRAFCTTASCSASRSVILTGLHNHANGHYGHQHSYHHFSAFEKVKSLPNRLEEFGYRTGQVGKYHVAPEQVFKFQNRFRASARSPIEMAESCRDFIQSTDEAPFFLYFCFSDPHRGGGFAEELPHQPDRFGNVVEGYPGIIEEKYDADQVKVPAFLPDNPPTRAEIAQYYQSISRLDQGVGKILDYLEESEIMDNTMIIYISDNGMAFPGAKTTLYEAGMQLPCLAKLPDQKSGSSSQEMISWIDITPTILDVAGVPIDSNEFHGISFVPAIEGGTLNRSAVFASHTFHEITMYYPMRVMRSTRYKLIMNLASGLQYPFASDLQASKTWQSLIDSNASTLGKKPIEEFLFRPRFELYDLENDPHEVHNLIDQTDLQGEIESMTTALQNFQKTTGDPWAYKWQYE